VSTESITSTSQVAGPRPVCSSCGAPIAEDQRYCLECGERQMPRSSFLLGGPQAGSSTAAAPSAPPTPPKGVDDDSASRRSATLTGLAGIGLLLLAMGVGVLIGRAGDSKGGTSAPQVITVGSVGGTAAASTAAGEATFTSDWPAGTTGYTVQLQNLPSSSSVTAVEAAKSAASAKGASAVGALKAEEFSILTSSGFVIYSGDYRKKSEAEKAKAGLAASFPAAKVVEVSNKSSSSEPAAATKTGSGKGVGESLNNPAPASTLKSLKGAKGKSYEEKSKNLPDVIETG
jgi:hypothetical protein